MPNWIKKIIFKLGGINAYTQFYYLKKRNDIKKKVFSEPEIDIFKHFIKNGDDVFDIGSNYGHLAVVFSQLTPKGKVFAFEPIPFTYAVNAKIIAHFKATNVQLFNLGVGEKPEVVEFKVPTLDFGAPDTGLAFNGKRKFLEHQNFIQVQAKIESLDAFIAHEVNNLSFVKIDIEGAEYFALKGMSQLLEKFKPTVFIEVCPEYIEGFGLTTLDLDNFLINELGYLAFLLEEKLVPKTHLENANYLLIHSSKVEHFKHLIK